MLLRTGQGRVWWVIISVAPIFLFDAKLRLER